MATVIIVCVSLFALTFLSVGDAQIVECNGSNCQCPTSSIYAGTTCVLQCNSVDICKGKTLTCRPGDDCEIQCGDYASCSSNAVINAQSASNVNIICSGIDSCKDSIDITCGTGHCGLRCDEKTSCDDWGSIHVSRAESFQCIGHCPSSLPAKFGIPPTASPTSTPSLPPTLAPTYVPTLPPSIRTTRTADDVDIKPSDHKQETTRTILDTLLPIPWLSEPLFYVITLAVMLAICCGCIVCVWLYFQHRHTKQLLQYQLRRIALHSCSSPKMSQMSHAQMQMHMQMQMQRTPPPPSCTQLHKLASNHSVVSQRCASDACSEQKLVSPRTRSTRSRHYKVSDADSTNKQSMSEETTTSSNILYDAVNKDAHGNQASDDDDMDEDMYIPSKRTPGAFIQHLFKKAPKPLPKKSGMQRLSPSPSPPSYFKVEIMETAPQDMEFEHVPLPEAATQTCGADDDSDNQEPDSQCIHSMEGVVNCNNCAYCKSAQCLPLRRNPTCKSVVEEPGACPVLKGNASEYANSPVCITPFLGHRKFTSIPSLPTLPHTSYSRDLRSPYKSSQDLYSALPSMQLSHVDDHEHANVAHVNESEPNIPSLMKILSQKPLSPRFASSDDDNECEAKSDSYDAEKDQNGEESKSETATFIGCFPSQ